MGILVSQTIVPAGITPSAVAVAASDTIAASQFGATGVIMRVINGGGSPDLVAVLDPTKTGLNNAGTVVPVSVTNATTREIFIPTAAIDPVTQVATVTHSFLTSVTCEVKRI